MTDDIESLQRKIRELESELSIRRATGQATNDLLGKVRPLVLAAQMEGGIHALRSAAKDYTPDQGTWEGFLTRRADSLQEKRDRFDAGPR